MVKVITLRCPECGNTYSFNVGAGAQLASWHDVSTRITDKKEHEKIMEIFVKLSAQKSKAAMLDFSSNPAEVLNNIRYDLCGVEVKKLLDAEGKIVEEKYIGEKVKESVEASGEKWVSAIQKEGIVAFDAMFFCPKTQKIKQGMYLSVRWKENEDKAYVYPNKCEECSSAMILIDDENIGFMHEDCRTIGHCEKCRVPLVVEKVSFKVPQQEAQLTVRILRLGQTLRQFFAVAMNSLDNSRVNEYNI